MNDNFKCSSRDAVESSIELSKENKSITWKKAVKKMNRITRWEWEKEKNEKA